MAHRMDPGHQTRPRQKAIRAERTGDPGESRTQLSELSVLRPRTPCGSPSDALAWNRGLPNLHGRTPIPGGRGDRMVLLGVRAHTTPNRGPALTAYSDMTHDAGNRDENDMTNVYPLLVSDPETCVHTKAGALQGVYEDGVRIFRGVPFAAPPVDRLRFRAPRPVEPWTGIRPAHSSGSAAAQICSTNRDRVLAYVRELDPGVPGIFPWPDYAMATYDQPGSGEDCLYLDIWAPPERDSAKLPVLVYYHGGANAVSSGSFELERGSNLARDQHIIVVRPNYRMGAVGWVHFGLVVDGLDEAVNHGLQDQLAALAWVRENIANFGGDPDNITVAGESAGATAVSQILTNPKGRGHVRRAIMQSLSPFNNWCTQQRPEAETVARMYCELLNANNADELMSVEVERYLAVQNIMTRYFEPDANVAWRPLGAVVDDHWLPEAPAHYLSHQRGELHGIDMVIGFAKDEWQFFRGHSDTARAGTQSDVLAVLRQVFGDDAPAVYERYSMLHPTHKPGHLLSDVMSFEFFKLSSL